MSSNMNFFSSLKVKLVVIFLLLSLVPVGAVALVSLNAAQATIKHEIFEKLNAANKSRKARVIARMDEKEMDLDMLSQTQDIREASGALAKYYETSGGTAEGPYKTKTPEYQALYDKMDPVFRKYVKEYGCGVSPKFPMAHEYHVKPNSNCLLSSFSSPSSSASHLILNSKRYIPSATA